jgi:type II secretory ATPase GspE/PulE/Tfp pilus assembly ATPase PilB-like protein
MMSEAALFKNLQAVTGKIHATDDIHEIIVNVSDDVCSVFEAERLTIFAASEDGGAMVSKVKNGFNAIHDLRIPVSAERSVTGYAAYHKKLVNLRDAYDEQELRTFDPPMAFLRQVDERPGVRTRQMLIAPILDPRDAGLVGVVQMVNRRSNQPFSKMFEDAATELCKTLAIAFRQRAESRPALPSKFHYLIVEGLLSAREFDLAASLSRLKNVSMEAQLRSEFKLKSDVLGRSLARYFRVEYEPFRKDRVRPEELFRNLKREFVVSHAWIPLDESDGTVIVLAKDPERVCARREVQDILGRQKVEYRVTTESEFDATIEQFFGESATMARVDLDAEPEPEVLEAPEETLANDNEVVKLVNKMIIDAHAAQASDIHIEPRPGSSRTRIRFRRDGSLGKYLDLPSRLRKSVVARIKIMANLDIAQKLKPQDGKIKFKAFHPLDIELRVATIPTAGGMEDVVMRILASGEPLPLEALGLTQRNLAALKTAVSKPYGLFFVCGPTGSGKTTTLHSVLKFLNTDDTKIWTAEDPVEITQDGLRQVQVNKKQELTFATCMRAFLRADPDVIMVGEMRDKETASVGIEASLTGHLVLATLHTNSAPESIIRLLDMGMDPFNFSDAILGILAQRLAKRLCPACRKPRQATPDDIKALLLEYCEELKGTRHWLRNAGGGLKAVYDDWGTRYADGNGRFVLYSAAGCDSCAKGYRGRVALHELLIGTDALKSDIQGRRRVAEMFTTALNDGMRTLKQDGIEKILQGHTDMDQVRAVCIK